MSDMNSISVTGHLAADAEQRFISNGESVVNARIAVNGFKKDSPPLWLGVTIFGKRGESVLPYLQKGTRIGVVGRLQVREWDKKDGSGKGTSVEIVAGEVTLLGSKGEGGERQQGAAPARAPAQRQQAATRPAGTEFTDDPFPTDDDIPF